MQVLNLSYFCLNSFSLAVFLVLLDFVGSPSERPLTCRDIAIPGVVPISPAPDGAALIGGLGALNQAAEYDSSTDMGMK